MCLTITCMDSARRKDSSGVHYVFLKKRKGRLFLLEVVFKLKCICINHMSKLFIFTRNLYPTSKDDMEELQYYLQFVILNLQYTCYFLFCVSSLRKQAVHICKFTYVCVWEETTVISSVDYKESSVLLWKAWAKKDHNNNIVLILRAYL